MMKSNAAPRWAKAMALASAASVLALFLLASFSDPSVSAGPRLRILKSQWEKSPAKNEEKDEDRKASANDGQPAANNNKKGSLAKLRQTISRILLLGTGGGGGGSADSPGFGSGPQEGAPPPPPPPPPDDVPPPPGSLVITDSPTPSPTDSPTSSPTPPGHCIHTSGSIYQETTCVESVSPEECSNIFAEQNSWYPGPSCPNANLMDCPPKFNWRSFAEVALCVSNNMEVPCQCREPPLPAPSSGSTTCDYDPRDFWFEYEKPGSGRKIPRRCKWLTKDNNVQFCAGVDYSAAGGTKMIYDTCPQECPQSDCSN